MSYFIRILLGSQVLLLERDGVLLKRYVISSGKNGVGEEYGSEKTPRGLHVIESKFGEGMPVNTVFVERKPTGEVYSALLREQFPGRDWILTRIMRLSGLEAGKNQGGRVDTYSRCIYIHGCPDESLMGVPGSRGCIRLLNPDMIELFDWVPVNTQVLIEE